MDLVPFLLVYVEYLLKYTKNKVLRRKLVENERTIVVVLKSVENNVVLKRVGIMKKFEPEKEAKRCSKEAKGCSTCKSLVVM